MVSFSVDMGSVFLIGAISVTAFVIFIKVYLKVQIKKRTKELTSSEKLLRQVSENMLDMVCQTDPSGKIIYVSPAYEKVIGFSEEDLLNTFLYDLLHPDDKILLEKFFKKFNLVDIPNRLEFRYRTSTEHYIWIEASGTYLYNEKDEAIGALFASRDITSRKIAEEMVWKQSQLQSSLLSSVPALVYMKDMDFRYIEVNERMAEFLGVTKNDILGKTDYDLFPEDTADIYYRTDAEVIAQNKILHHIQIIYKTKEGNNICLSTSKMPYYDTHGEMMGLAGVSIDVTEQINTDVQHQITQFAVDHASQAIIMFDKSGAIIYLNDYAASSLNSDRESLLKKSIWDIIPLEGHEEWNSYWLELKEKKSDKRTLLLHDERYAEVNISYFQHNEKEYCISYSADITARKKADEQLLASESRYKQIVENIFDVIWIQDLELNTTFITPSIERLTGYTVKEHLSQTMVEKFTPESMSIIREWYEHYLPALKRNEIDRKTFIHKGEVAYKKKGGGYVWVELIIKILLDTNGEMTGMHGTVINIHDRKLAELELINSKIKYKSIFENINDIYYEVSLNNTILVLSPSFEKLSKYKREDVIGTLITDYYKFPEERDGFMQQITEKGAVSDYEITLLDKDGNSIESSITATLLCDDTKKPLKICGTIRDIRERKKTDRLRLESEKKYKTLVDLSPNPILVLQNDKFVYGNPAALNMLKCENIEELMHNEPLQYLYEEDKEMFLNYLKEVKSEANVPSIETRVVNKRNEIISILSNAIIIDFGGISSYLIVGQEITMFKQYEADLLNAKAKAEESDRLKSSFLANMSHEIRTPLNGIIGFAGLLRKPNISHEKLDTYTQIIQSGSHQLLALINDIIDISKIEAGQMKLNNDVVALNDIMIEMYSLYKNQAEKKNIELYVSKELPDKNCDILSDETKIKQILNNLLNNALKFTEEGKVEFGYKIKSHLIEFWVKDSGIGIPNEFHNVVFERFRQVELSDNRKFGGTGLGLSISKALVEMLGGKIRIENNKSGGTAFYFNIPFVHLKKDEIEDLEPETIPVFDWTQKTILVAEDENTNYFFLEELINETGAKILYAEDGLEAVDLFVKHAEIDLVILDIKMPEMDGYQVLAEIRKMKPGMPVIAQTAYAMSNDKVQALSAGFSDYISKPIERAVFFKVVNQHLNDK